VAKSPDGLPYDYREATHIYGKRSVPAQGIVFHMAEGCSVASYLAGDNVLRGVSAHFTIEADGTVIQMVPLDSVSGSLNPRDVRTSNDPSGRYGRRFTRYYDPDILTGMANHRTISVEMAGRASDAWTCGGKSFPPGINDAQVAAAIGLTKRLREKYKRPIGVNGHRDFADYKACPGNGAGIRQLLEAVGHGAEQQDPPQPEPEDPDVTEMRLKYEAEKAKREEAEDVIADLVKPATRVANRLGAYVPKPNE
jgi:hypothetical protein